VAKELLLQKHVANSAFKQGGYGRKLSHAFTVGIPDLLLAVPPFAPAIWEVKDFGAVVDKFDLQLSGSPTTPVTPKQRDEMRKFSYPYEQRTFGPVAGVMVGIQHGGRHMLLACTRDQERVSFRDFELGTYVFRGVGGFYDLESLFRSIGMARMEKIGDQRS
jgi:hypothetical protein